MFNDKEKNLNKIETLIGEQCNIVGTITGEGVLQFDGTIKGDILWQDDINIGIPSYCNGNITCKNAYINGNIDGNVICDNVLTIEPCGKVKGDITVKNLIIKEGGSFDGKCTMIISKKSEDVLG